MTETATQGARSPYGTRSVAFRVLVTWLSNAIALLLISGIFSDVYVDSPGAALVAAALLGLINAVVWPLVIRFALPLAVATFGLGVLILNGLVVLAVAAIDTGLHVKGLPAAIGTALGLTLMNTLVTMALAIDDDDVFSRNIIKRQVKRSGGAITTDVPGVFFLEIDGLAHDVLFRAIRDGNVPTISRWLREGSHRLYGWETDWSSQTGACQAGILHGDNDDMPAFRWWEKDLGRAMVSNHPRDAAEIERRHSDGNGLLSDDGCSRANLLSGDAVHSLLTMSTVLNVRRKGQRIGSDYFAYFARPYTAARTLLLVLGEVVMEMWQASQQKRLDIHPRVPREFPYPLVRAFTTVIQRDLQVQALIADLLAGRPVAYTTFLGYDEVAHHSGIERPETLTALRRVDRQFERLEQAARSAPRPYHLVVLSDHGQSQGATFLSRYGQTLEELVDGLCDGDVAADTGGGDEGLGYLSAGLTEAGGGDSLGAKAVRGATRKRRADDGVVQLKEGDGPKADEADEAEAPPEIVVMASGCLGLISFPRQPGRVTYEWLQQHHPRLLPALVAHEGIGFVLVDSTRDGGIVLGADGAHRLDTGQIQGIDPLLPYGPNAAAHVKRTHGFPHCADIMLNSTYWTDTDEVAAFEELVGSHGGMGGTQSHPFVLAPVGFAAPAQEIVGAETLHRQLKRWLADLGHDAHA